MIERGDRIALVGPNGAGKSTLMRILAGDLQADEGVRLLGHKVVLDYFAQDQAAVLNPSRTVLEEMSSASSVSMGPMIRTILGGFLFGADDVFKKVAVLSGGERNRLALAKMLLNPSSVLLLDEPTNHLDLDSKEVLLDALEDYGGTLVFVSHDRYFVDNLATKVIEVGGGEAPLYPGGYEDFLYWKRQRETGVTTGSPVAVPGGARTWKTGPPRSRRRRSPRRPPRRPLPPHPLLPRRPPLPSPPRRSQESPPERPPASRAAFEPPRPTAAPVRHPARAPGARARAEAREGAPRRAREAGHRGGAGRQGARGPHGRARLLRRSRPRRPGRRGAPEAHVGGGRPHGPVGGPAGRGRREVASSSPPRPRSCGGSERPAVSEPSDPADVRSEAGIR